MVASQEEIITTLNNNLMFNMHYCHIYGNDFIYNKKLKDMEFLVNYTILKKNIHLNCWNDIKGIHTKVKYQIK